MCGIVGYVGKTGSLQVILESLKRLEYRGYDSAGIAFQNGHGLEIYKTRGKLKDLQKILPDLTREVRIGIGHTRWATHGAPSLKNAHPHVVDGIAVVHNGIIENYRELKSELEQEGRRFLSETDTEVVPQLIAKYVTDGYSIRDAIREAAAKLRGTFALGIMSAKHPRLLFALRRGSPLVVGVGTDTYYFASDIPALLPYTRKFIFLEDGQICTLSDDSMAFHLLDSDAAVPCRSAAVDIDWSPAMAEKAGHPHFMHKEIYEQPAAVRATLGERLADPRGFLLNLGIRHQRKTDLARLHIVSCGTSYHAGLIGKYLIERLSRIPVSVEFASEYRYRDPVIGEGTQFIAITQSGETADTLAAQREAKQKGARILTICNVVGSTSTREADAVLYTRGGPEIGVASTKTFTTQLAALSLIALGLGYGRNCLDQEALHALQNSLAAIPDLIEKTLKLDDKIAALARILAPARDFLYLGRGINYPIALEGALKLKEISYIHAEGHPAGEMKHGPIALIEQGLPVVVVAHSNDLFDKLYSNVEEVKARNGRIIAITDAPEAFAGKADDIIEVPSAHPLFAPFLFAVPLQLLAYHIGVQRGCDVDQPRNLAKSVTVE